MTYHFTFIYLSLGSVFPLFKSSKVWHNVIISLENRQANKQKSLQLFSLFKSRISFDNYYLQKTKCQKSLPNPNKMLYFLRYRILQQYVYYKTYIVY